MALQSMTGFARREGTSGGMRWIWELRSVNGKGLDTRIRLPQGYERYEPEIRRVVADAFSRGNIQVALSVNGQQAALEPQVNEEVLGAILEVVERLRTRIDAAPPSIDGLLNMRGVIDFREPDEDEATVAERDAECLAGLSAAVADLLAMRRGEGAALGEVLLGHVDTIAALTETIEADPSRTAAAVRERIGAQVALLLESADGLDASRLAMEAALLATKADLREEIDRLKAHVAASRELLAKGGPVGRRLDFLAQEFNREANTVCSKSNAASVTAAGLELKVVIDQFREQVQNLE